MRSAQPIHNDLLVETAIVEPEYLGFGNLLGDHPSLTLILGAEYRDRSILAKSGKSHG
jgi:hypothetical protein